MTTQSLVNKRLATYNPSHDLADIARKAPSKGIESPTAEDAYTSVGGLDKQIALIRDLIEIPLTRPELFRHLGVSLLIVHTALRILNAGVQD